MKVIAIPFPEYSLVVLSFPESSPRINPLFSIPTALSDTAIFILDTSPSLSSDDIFIPFPELIFLPFTALLIAFPSITPLFTIPSSRTRLWSSLSSKIELESRSKEIPFPEFLFITSVSVVLPTKILPKIFPVFSNLFTERLFSVVK